MKELLAVFGASVTGASSMATGYPRASRCLSFRSLTVNTDFHQGE